MTEIKIPLKHEIRSRAKVLTDEAFRETRNYLDVHNDQKSNHGREFFNNFYNKTSKQHREQLDKNALDQNFQRTSELRELLNKISNENYNTYLKHLDTNI